MVDRLVNTEANGRRIQSVETCFGASGQPLSVPGRVLVGEGVLIKMCRKKPKPRQFFLFNDILVYGNILISKRKYNKQHIIPLEDIQLEDVEDDGEIILPGGLGGKSCPVWQMDSHLNDRTTFPYPGFTRAREGVPFRVNVFRNDDEICVNLIRKRNKKRLYYSLVDPGTNRDLRNGWLIKTRKKSFAVFAATSTEKKEWVVHINRCVDDLLSRSGKQAATDHAAVWVPDSDASLCMQCKKTQFNLIQRRHHCRNCGAVVCSSCSSKRYLLPSISRTPSRVCANCYESLTKKDPQPSHTAPQQEAQSSDDEWSSPDEDEDRQGFQENQDRAPTFYRPT